jgi:hypothetical protein
MVITLHKNITVYFSNVYPYKKNFRALHYVPKVLLSLVFIMLVLLTPRKEAHEGYDIPIGIMVTLEFTKIFPMSEKLCVERKTETY